MKLTGTDLKLTLNWLELTWFVKLCYCTFPRLRTRSVLVETRFRTKMIAILKKNLILRKCTSRNKHTNRLALHNSLFLFFWIFYIQKFGFVYFFIYYTLVITILDFVWFNVIFFPVCKLLLLRSIYGSIFLNKVLLTPIFRKFIQLWCNFATS